MRTGPHEPTPGPESSAVRLTGSESVEELRKLLAVLR